MKLVKSTLILMMWRESSISMFDALEQFHIQSGVWNAKLDDDFASFDGVTGSALR